MLITARTLWRYLFDRSGRVDTASVRISMDHSERSSSVSIVLIQEYALFVYVFQVVTSIFSVLLQ